MAPTPKPPGQRVRRNAQQSQWRTLEPRKGAVPALPERDEGWSERVVAWWKAAWRSPMASAWLDADFDALVRLAELKERVGAGEGVGVALPAIQQLEDRFGLSPKARRALQWEVSMAQAAESGRAQRADVRRLRAVDAA